jgi:hypothetical protein
VHGRAAGVDVCNRPGTGAGEGGLGTATNQRLSFTEDADSGSQPFAAEFEDEASSWDSVGIQTAIVEKLVGAIRSTLVPCNEYANGETGRS